MQINFKATKLKEANEYVSLLQPSKLKLKVKPHTKKKSSLFKRAFQFLFR